MKILYLIALPIEHDSSRAPQNHREDDPERPGLAHSQTASLGENKRKSEQPGELEMVSQM